MWSYIKRIVSVGNLSETRAEAVPAQQGLRTVLGRSLFVRHVDTGSCNACELEIQALHNPYYNLEAFGVRFVASPRHADLLLVTGPVSRAMIEPLRRAYEAMPAPKMVLAMGDCPRDGGVFAGNYACAGGLQGLIPVDAYLPGCPPDPQQLLAAILQLVQRRLLPADSAAPKSGRVVD